MNTTTMNNKAGQDSPGVTLMPPTIFYACLILGGVLEFFLPTTWPPLSGTGHLVLGLLLAGSGFAFMMAAHKKFEATGTNVKTNLPATVFITRGVFRYSRNPMYVGGGGFFLGIGLAVGSLWMLAAFIPLGMYLALYVVPREEAYMERAYAQDFADYCNKVRRWL